MATHRSHSIATCQWKQEGRQSRRQTTITMGFAHPWRFESENLRKRVQKAYELYNCGSEESFARTMRELKVWSHWNPAFWFPALLSCSLPGIVHGCGSGLDIRIIGVIAIHDRRSWWSLSIRAVSSRPTSWMTSERTAMQKNIRPKTWCAFSPSLRARVVDVVCETWIVMKQMALAPNLKKKKL